MKKDLRALVCFAAIVGAVSTGTAHAVNFELPYEIVTDDILGTTETRYIDTVSENKTYDNVTVRFNADNDVCLTVEEYITLTVNDTLSNSETVNNNGTIKANSIINALNTSVINNIGSIETVTMSNSGSITNDAGNLTITKGTNNGTITQNNFIVTAPLEEGDKFTNTKDIYANIQNSGTFENRGNIGTSTNRHSITNLGIFKNFKNVFASGLTNDGKTLENSSKLDVDGAISNVGGTITNSGAGTISAGSVDNSNNGSITNSGTGSVTVTGSINNDGGTITNSGTGKIKAGSINNKGTINLSRGSLEVTNQTNDLTSTINATNNVNLKVSGNGEITGELNIGTAGETTSSTLNLDAGKVSESAKVSLYEKSTLNIQNAACDVKLNGNDKWLGKINLSRGKLSVNSIGSNGTINATGGSLDLKAGDLTVEGTSVIEKEVALNINGKIIIGNGGIVTLNNKDGEVGIDTFGTNAHIKLDEGGTLEYWMNTENDPTITSKIDAKGGILNLHSGSYLKFDGGHIKKDAQIHIMEGSKLKLASADTILNLDNDDSWKGQIINNGGTINTNGLTETSSTASLIQDSGDTNILEGSSVILGKNSSVTGGEINIKGNSKLTSVNATITRTTQMTIDDTSEFYLQSGNFDLSTLDAPSANRGALVNVINGQFADSQIDTLTIADAIDFHIDIHARSNKLTNNDTFIITSGEIDSGDIYVSDWKLNGDIFGWDAPIDRNIDLKLLLVDENGKEITGTENNILVTDKEIFTPIGWYEVVKHKQYKDVHGHTITDPTEKQKLKYNQYVKSNYSFDLQRFNPQVFRGQIATIAQLQNQLSINDMLFTHSMILPSFKDDDLGSTSGVMANRYAAESPLFAPYQYSRKDGGLWYKMYGTFEHLQMNQGLGVENNSYGALIGADFGLKELNNGWKFMPTAYLGYNGAHQRWGRYGVSAGNYQNGGQLGFLGTWYKDNLILGAVAYGGLYNNEMNGFGQTEESFNYFGGTAIKSAYNLRLHRDLVLQPNLFASYNYFGQQNWHSNFGQMGMMASDLNGVNIAPGVNLILEKETFSTYLTLQYMYNINGAVGGRAGNVSLPHVEMERGYIQYGIGFTKKFTDRFAGYLQAVLRNVGRTGCGFQAGFNIQLGK